MDSTCKNTQGNKDNDEEEDELLHDLTQEFEFREESGPPIHKKTRKSFTGLPVGYFQERKSWKGSNGYIFQQKFKKFRKNLIQKSGEKFPQNKVCWPVCSL